MEGLIWVVIIVVIVAMILWAVSKDSSGKQVELQAAKRDYEKALIELKRLPNDPNVKQNTLALGRGYSNLTRDKKGVTIFDEMALMNDINAACAAATFSKPVTGVSASIVEERLTKLLKLKSKNLITVEEYEQRRQKILDDI